VSEDAGYRQLRVTPRSVAESIHGFTDPPGVDRDSRSEPEGHRPRMDDVNPSGVALRRRNAIPDGVVRAV